MRPHSSIFFGNKPAYVGRPDSGPSSDPRRNRAARITRAQVEFRAPVYVSAVVTALLAVPGGVHAESGLRAHLELQRLQHLADINQGGLRIDFGTPARMKYTHGGWKTGWGQDGKEGQTRFSYVEGTTARVFFPLPRAREVTLRLRLKALGSRNMQLFLNNKRLASVRMARDKAFRVYDVAVPGKRVVAGDNRLLLRFRGTRKLAGRRVSVAMDWIHVLPGHTPPPDDLQPEAPVVTRVQAAGVSHPAIVMPAPASMSWHLQVPEKAELRFALAAAGTGSGASSEVRVVTVDGKASRAHSAKGGGGWQQVRVSLERWAGQLVRLEFAARGRGKIAWQSPTVLVPASTDSDESEQARNVIVLLIDTLRADKLRPYRPQSRVKTPAFDRIANQGVLFEQAQSPENWTKPAVASVLTGLYPMTHRTKTGPARLPRQALMISEVFQAAGFATASFIANGYVSNKFGFKQGWDHYTNYIRESKRTEAEQVFTEAARWIKKHKSKRFFAYVHTIDPHVPYDPPKSFLKWYDPKPYRGKVKNRMTAQLLEGAKRNPPRVRFSSRDLERLQALHAAEISYHDHHLADFVAKLKQYGVYDNTLFVITSDHGEEFNEHGSYGHGHSVYQELLHVPWVARWPGVLAGGKRISETVGTLDIAPTVLAAAGLPIPEVMEGTNRLGHMRGVAPPGPQVAFSDFLDDQRVIRAGRYKLILRAHVAVLYDLETDPLEQHPLVHAKHPMALRYCRGLLGQFLGAKDRRYWLTGTEAADREELKAEDTEIDPTTREQLRQLGYTVDG